jgi:hypothetical protein
MSLPGLLIAMFGTVLVAVLIFAPVMRHGVEVTARTEVEAVRRERDGMKVAYSAVLRTLRDLDEDYATGKLHESDYRAEQTRWKAEGVRLLKELEATRAAAYPDEEPGGA